MPKKRSARCSEQAKSCLFYNESLETTLSNSIASASVDMNPNDKIGASYFSAARKQRRGKKKECDEGEGVGNNAVHFGRRSVHLKVK